MTATEGRPLQLDEIAQGPPLQLDEIQGIVLRSRPSPYVGTYILLRVDDPRAGRELMGRLAELVDSAANWWQPSLPALLNVGLTHRGLEALEVPATSLRSFPEEFRQGMPHPRTPWAIPARALPAEPERAALAGRRPHLVAVHGGN
jgi:hypothetical protein